MDISSILALLTEIRMEDLDNNDDDYNCIFSRLMDDTLPEVDYDPNQFQQKSFRDVDDDEFASADQFTKAMAPVQLIENVNNSKISVTSSSSDFVNSNYQLIQSPASFNFISMILEESMNDKVDGYTDNNGSNSVVTKFTESNKRNRSSIGRNQTQNKDHILSERKRREKLSQLFIALAAMVPGLKKTDKTSILAGAIHRMKQLKEKEASLKHQVKNIKKKVPIETCTLGKEILSNYSSLSSSSSSSTSVIVENIDVKYEGRHILIRINIDHNIKKGVIINLLHRIEMNGLTISESCFFPYGNSALAITIVAKMDNLFSLTANELMRKLRTLIDHQC